jgi:hypothetical protein
MISMRSIINVLIQQLQSLPPNVSLFMPTGNLSLGTIEPPLPPRRHVQTPFHEHSRLSPEIRSPAFFLLYSRLMEPLNLCA